MKPLDKSNMRVGKPAAPAKGEAFAPNEERNFVSAEAWIEHLEAEMEPTCSLEEKQDLELVLKNSAEDAGLLASLKHVRAAVESLADDVALPESGQYYDELHSKIMAAIDNDIAMNGEPDRTVRSSVKRRPVLISSLFGAFGMTMMIAIVAFVGLHQRNSNTEKLAQVNAQREQVLEENFERKIAMVDSHSGAIFAREMGSFESEEDFLTETAAARLKQVSPKQADAIIKGLKR